MPCARVLCLHGFGQNASILEAKLAQARRVCKDEIEFVFVNGPIVLTSPTLSSTANRFVDSTMDGRFRAYWPNALDDTIPLASEFSALVTYLASVLRTQGPFDGILGFSMGAATAALLAALVERPWLHPAFSAAFSSTEALHSPFRSIVLCSGYLPLDPTFESWFDRPLDTAALHVIGKQDVVAPNDRSLLNVPRFKESTVLWHDGGHHIPRKATFALALRNFILEHSATPALPLSAPASPAPSDLSCCSPFSSSPPSPIFTSFTRPRARGALGPDAMVDDAAADKELERKLDAAAAELDEWARAHRQRGKL
ncbi:hypothetical protein JCM10207_002468 [Rhodosporidiobolus poonsookiae]